MPTEQFLNSFVINQVDTTDTLDAMDAAGLVNPNELYLVEEGNFNIVVDEQPTEGSSNLVTSGGVYQAIQNIPTPDVSGQISQHNTSAEAHADIRTEMSGKATEQYVDDKFFVVNVASNKTADKTYAEIQAASAAGKNVVAIYSNLYHFNLVMCVSGVAYFSASLYMPEDGHGLMGLNIHDDGTCVFDSTAVGYTKPIVALVQTEWKAGSEQGLDAPFAYIAAASGVTGDNTVIVAPNPQYQDAYAAAGIKCINQGTDMLLFTANSVPDTDIPMNIIVLRGE